MTDAEMTCNAPDYPEVAGRSIREMYRQVGDLVLDEKGIAQRSLMVRHLVLPDGQAGTRKIIRLQTEMPCARTDQFREISGIARIFHGLFRDFVLSCFRDKRSLSFLPQVCLCAPLDSISYMFA
ncbi:MAG: hypothetical protein DRI24_02070 [Deltaproteobacteria bacterium]|nr:MAG: hypothetical protein DRI24_02070 [Deltaproteobacteria bacterium]